MKNAIPLFFVSLLCIITLGLLYMDQQERNLDQVLEANPSMYEETLFVLNPNGNLTLYPQEDNVTLTFPFGAEFNATITRDKYAGRNYTKVSFRVPNNIDSSKYLRGIYSVRENKSLVLSWRNDTYAVR